MLFSKVFSVMVHQMFELFPDVMTVAQAAEALQLAETTIYRLIREKELRCLHVGRKILIPKPYLLDFTLPDLVVGKSVCYNENVAIVGESQPVSGKEQP